MRLLDEELGLFDFFRLDDPATLGRDTQRILLGGKRCGGDDPSRQGQRVSRLPRECLCKAGGNYQEDSEPRRKY
jgi:hypothetical protein